MLKEKESFLQKLVLFFDASIIAVAFFVAYFLRKYFQAFYKLDIFPSKSILAGYTSTLSEYLVILFLVIPLWCLIFYLSGMYASLRTRKLFEIVWIVLRSSFISILVFGAFVFLLKLEFVSRLFFAIFFIISFIFILLEKIVLFSIIHYVRRKGISYRRVLVVGTGNRAVNLVRTIKNHPEWGFNIIGVIDDEPKKQIKNVDDILVIGPLYDLSSIIHKNSIDDVIFVVPRSRLSYIEDAIHSCEIEGIRAIVAVDLFDLRIAKSHITAIGSIPLVTFETTIAKEWELVIKRLIDVVLSGLGIILLGPIFFIVAILVKISSPGPILFKQERASLNGRKFKLFKFRTMYKGADKILSQANIFNDMDKSDFQEKKMKFITPIGKFLRKFSLDELPQLFNVLAGNMSLVGPRPLPLHEVEEFKPWQRRRLSVRAGITCLWQVNGRNKINYNDWMKLDLEYLDNWSLWLDFKILVKTIPVVLFGRGAY